MIGLFAWLTFLECEVTIRYWVLSQVYFVLFILSVSFCDQQLGHKQQFLSSVIHLRSVQILASTKTGDLLIAYTLLNLLRHNSFLFSKFSVLSHYSLDLPHNIQICLQTIWLFLLDKSRVKTHAYVGPLLPLNPQAVLSPSASLVHSNVIFFLSLKMFAFFNDLSLSSNVFVFVVWNVMSRCTESPLSHSGLSNQEHIRLRSPLPCHQWLGKKWKQNQNKTKTKNPAHSTIFLT